MSIITYKTCISVNLITPHILKGSFKISNDITSLEKIRISLSGFLYRKFFKNSALNLREKFYNKSFITKIVTSSEGNLFEMEFLPPLLPSIICSIDGRGEFGVEYFIRADILEEEIFNDRLNVKSKGEPLLVNVQSQIFKQQEMIETIERERNLFCCLSGGGGGTIKISLTIDEREIDKDIIGYIHISNRTKKTISSIRVSLVQLIKTRIPLRKLCISDEIGILRFKGLRGMEEDGAPISFPLPPPSTSTTMTNEIFDISHYIEVRIYGGDNCLCIDDSDDIFSLSSSEMITKTIFNKIPLKIY